MELFFSVDAFSFINRVTLAISHSRSLPFVVFHRLFRPSNTLFVLSDAFFIISWRIKFSSYDTIVAGIIYDTHGANIYIKICTTKFLSKFLKWELFTRRRYPISLPGSESWGRSDVWRYRNLHTVATWKDPIWAVSKRDVRTLRSKRCVSYVTPVSYTHLTLPTICSV